jgi:hypothetical protein
MSHAPNPKSQTHIFNSRIFAFLCSASTISLTTVSENVQFQKLNVSNEWPRRLLEQPQQQNVHLSWNPSILAHTLILVDACCGSCLQQTLPHS